MAAEDGCGEQAVQQGARLWGVVYSKEIMKTRKITPQMPSRNFPSTILDKSYKPLLKLGEESLRAARPAEFQAMVLTEEEKDSPLHQRNWKYLSEIPSHTEEQRIVGDLNGGRRRQIYAESAQGTATE